MLDDSCQNGIFFLLNIINFIYIQAQLCNSSLERLDKVARKRRVNEVASFQWSHLNWKSDMVQWYPGKDSLTLL